MKSIYALAAAASLAAVSAVSAQEPGYFEIDPGSVRIMKIGEVEPKELKALGLPVGPIGLPKLPGVGNSGTVVLDQIVNIANKVWNIIKENRPVVDIKTTYATAVPKGIDHWDQLSGWSRPAGTKYGFYAKNRLGQRVVSVDYVVFRTYNGKYDGKGRYLTNVTVLPTRTHAAWGYTLTMSVDAAKPTNVGTAENPMAGMQMTLAWKMANPIKDEQGRSVFYLEGDGTFQRMAGPFANADRDRVSGSIREMGKALRSGVPAAFEGMKSGAATAW